MGCLGRVPGWPVVRNDYGSAVTTQSLVDEETSIHAGRAPRAQELKAPVWGTAEGGEPPLC